MQIAHLAPSLLVVADEVKELDHPQMEDPAEERDLGMEEVLYLEHLEFLDKETLEGAELERD